MACEHCEHKVGPGRELIQVTGDRQGERVPQNYCAACGRNLRLPVAQVRASFYYMHDFHLFTKFEGSTLEEVIQHCNTVRAESPWGMLCPVTVLHGDKELRRVGRGVHDRGNEKPGDWEEQLAAWYAAVSADADIMATFGPVTSTQ